MRLWGKRNSHEGGVVIVYPYLCAVGGESGQWICFAIDRESGREFLRAGERESMAFFSSSPGIMTRRVRGGREGRTDSGVCNLQGSGTAAEIRRSSGAEPLGPCSAETATG